MPADERFFNIAVAVLIFFLLVSIRRRREAIRHAIRTAFLAEGAYIVVVYLMVQAGNSMLEALLAGALCGLVVNQIIPRRSRHVPAAVRTRMEAEYARRTGKKVNRKKLELDHIIPYSKGGSHTEDNLRLVEKKKNRSKGAKSPWWDLLGR